MYTSLEMSVTSYARIIAAYSKQRSKVKVGDIRNEEWR